MTATTLIRAQQDTGIPRRPLALRRREGLSLGRQGVRYAIEEMTEQRVLTLKLD
jgi:hypothetical protein